MKRRMITKEQENGGPCGDGLGSLWLIWRRRRYILAILALLGFTASMIMRVNLGVAIVAMTECKVIGSTDGNDGNSTNNLTSVLSCRKGENDTAIYKREFDWDPETQGMLLSAFYYGQLFSTAPGGWMARKFGGKMLFGGGMLATAVFTVLTPPFAYLGSYYVVALRLLVGILEGLAWPAIQAMWGKWAPPLERATLASFTMMGMSVGPVVGMAMSGVLAQYGGWQCPFYVTGAVGIVWFVAWWLLISEGPREDPRISIRERNYIIESIGMPKDERTTVPWGSILTSIPVWSIAVAHFCEGWGYNTAMTQFPILLKETLKFSISEAGVLSSLPYAAMIVSLPFVSITSDIIIRRKIMTVTHARKLFNCTAFLAQGICLFGVTLIGSPLGIVAVLTVSQGIGSFVACGFNVNPLDLAPQFASVIMGLSCTIGTISGMACPLVNGFLVKNRAKEEWNIVFYITSGIYVFGAVFYGLFASGETQRWAKLSPSKVADKLGESQTFIKKGDANAPNGS